MCVCVFCVCVCVCVRVCVRVCVIVCVCHAWQCLYAYDFVHDISVHACISPCPRAWLCCPGVLGPVFYWVSGAVRFHTDPSGTLTPYAAHAIGNGAEGAVTMLQEKYSRSMTLADAELLVLRILKDTMEEKVSASNVQLASVRCALALHFGVKQPV